MLSEIFLNVTTRLPTFWVEVAASRGGKRCLRICTTRFPRGVEKPSKIRCGYDSDTVPREGDGRSCRRRTLCRENDAVGPCGRCEMVSAVGVPRCSCRRSTSVSAAELALATRVGRIRVPRFSRMEVGRRSLISLAKAPSRVEGDREVVIRGRGSAMPERWLYSSSRSSAGAASSYLCEERSAVSFARTGARGFPLEREALKAARFEAVSAERRLSARRYR